MVARIQSAVWTKTEYKKALAREEKEGRTVMLPSIVGEAVIPAVLEEKIDIDLRAEDFAGIAKLIGTAGMTWSTR